MQERESGEEVKERQTARQRGQGSGNLCKHQVGETDGEQGRASEGRR
jgi:hypothetical protein